VNTVPPVCFLHLPKTSGTAVKVFLQARFEPSEVCPARFAEDYRRTSSSGLGGYSLFHSECDAAVLGMLPAATQVVTFLRHPFARAVSHWRHVARHAAHERYREVDWGSGSFADFVARTPTNPMSRLLGAPADGGVRSFWDLPSEAPEDQLFERALAMLETCAVVGLAEEHDESLAQIAHRFGWAPPGRLPRLNVAPNDGPREPPERLPEFERRNSVDLAIYEAAAAMLGRRKAFVAPDARAAAYDRRISAESSPLVRRFTLDMAGVIRGTGWLPPIATQQGAGFRALIAGGTATVDVPVVLSRFAKIEITCAAAASTAALDALNVSVNGEELQLHTRHAPDGLVYYGLATVTGPGSPYTRLTFTAPSSTAVPASIRNEHELEFSVAVSQITLTPYNPSRLRASRRDSGGDGLSLRPEDSGGATVYWRSSPTWTIEPDLKNRLDQLELWDNVAELQRDGFTVVRGAVPHDVVESARSAICRLSVPSRHLTRRRAVLQPLRFDSLFIDLLMHPVQLALADVVCGVGMLDSQAGLVRDRLSHPQGLHAENALWLPSPYPEHHYICSAMLTLDDFNVANGGTCFVPGSHLSRRDPAGENSHSLEGTVTPVAPAGSFIVWLGGTWHGAHQRAADGERVSLLTIFTRPSLRPAQDVRAIPERLVTTDELRLRLRRADPFDHDGWKTGPDHVDLLHRIRNLPQTSTTLTAGWDPAPLSQPCSV
jgi:Phytanoyl-CoA dioxygenase (PhyH)